MSRKKIRDQYFAGLAADNYYEDNADEGALIHSANDFEGEFDIKALMDSARDPLTGTLRDLKIDDRDLKLAHNFMDWSLNFTKDSVPWSRQMWSMLKLFGEICPNPKCSHPDWFSDVYAVPKDCKAEDIQEKLTLLRLGVCPSCKRTKGEMIKEGLMHQYLEGVNVWGQRGGKSTTAVKGSAYHIHRFLKFPIFGTVDPSMSASTPLTATFVSLTYKKAISLLWEPFVNTLELSSWYDEYFDMLDYHGKKLGVELYAFKKEFIKFFNKKLNIHASHPNKSILRGDTRLLALLDELGLFPLPKGNDDEDEESERANADEAHKSLTNSLVTVQNASISLMKQGYNHVPTGIMLGVSSPMSRKDKVMRLLEDSKGKIGSKTILGIQLPTWEVNPSIDRDSPMIALAYEKNAEKAERDFGANPPMIDTMFVDINSLSEGIFVARKNSHKLLPKFTPSYTYAIPRKVNAHDGSPTLLTVDAGQVNNSFAVNVFKLNDTSGKTTLVTCLEVVPMDGTMINFRQMYDNLLLPLALEMNTVAVLADRWNSIDILHSMEKDLTAAGRKVYVKQYSVKRADFDAVIAMINNKTLEMPKTEMRLDEILGSEFENYRSVFAGKPVSHLAHQFTTVREVSPLKPPVKGQGYTDDLLRAFILGASQIHSKPIRKVLEEALKRKAKRTGSSGGIYISRGSLRRR